MHLKDEIIMDNIQQLSSSLSTEQLSQFVVVIESLAEMLQVANKDTEKAYQMYLKSVENSKEDRSIKRFTQQLNTNKHNIMSQKH